MNRIATDDDFLIPIHRLACMAYLASLVADAYYYWHSGSVHYPRAAAFLAKMRALYPIDATPGQRVVAKSKGRANVRLVMYPDQANTGYLLWFLLATPGRFPVDPLTGQLDRSKGFADLIFQRERLKDIRQIPLVWLGHYRLVQHQKAADPAKRRSRKTVWTWRMTPETYRQWELRLTEAASMGNRALNREFQPLLTSPMFSGIREHIADLACAAEAAFRKQHKGIKYESPLPPVLPYIRKSTVFQNSTLLAVVEQLRMEDIDAKARAMAAAKVVLSGVEPPNYFTQSLKEKHNGIA